MAIFVDTANEIEYAKIAQYLASNDIAKSQIFKGKSLNKNLPRLIYQVRTAIEWRYGVAPTDESLNDTVTYLIRLIGKYRAIAIRIVSGTPCIAPVITTNPTTQSVASGGNVTLTVVAVGTATITYQWYKNGVAISGQTSASYTITGFVSGDAGSYTVTASNTCGTATSSAAVLTITAPSLGGSLWYGDTDEWTNINDGIDILTYQNTFAITTGNPFSITIPLAASVNKYLVIRVPISESLKITWFNTNTNGGTIPDSVFYDSLTIGSFRYYLTRDAVSMDSTAPLILS